MKSRSALFPKVIVLVLVLLLISAIGIFTLTNASAYAAETTTTNIVHLSDLHVMIEEYCNPYSFKYNADTKTTKLLAETSAICEGVFEEIYNMETPPLYVFLTGDLTSNGEYENHVWVVNLLKAFTKKMRAKAGYEGFQIFVAPGNHDTYNCKAKSYMPTRAELVTATDVKSLVENYKTRSVATVTSKQFMDLYADFGFCSCPDRQNGHHLTSCNVAEGCALEYFFESDYWYDDTTDRNGTGLEVRTPSDATLKRFNESDKDYTILSEDARFGACSYIARVNDMAILSLDSNCRAYKYDNPKKRNTAAIDTDGWHETTGGLISDEQLKWALTSLEGDIAAGTTVFTLGHINMIPHFESEDEVISLFTYDNWEQATYTLADAGIRYGFTGHQHAADVVDYITQNGNVFYDIETGSLASYGCSWRSLVFTKTKTGDSYTEDFSSLVHNYNATPFTYGTFKLTNELTAADIPMTENPVTLFKTDADELLVTTLGDGILTCVQTVSVSKYGGTIGIADLLAEQMYDLAGSVEDGMAGVYVGNNLSRLLRELTADLSQTLYVFADKLEGIYLYEFTYNGNNYHLSDTVKAGYGINEFSRSLADFLVQYDFSFGKNAEKLTLADALMVIYGGHLSGAHSDRIDEEIKPLLTFLQNGGFVDFLITLLEDSLLPQLDLILDAPIRFNVDSPALLRGGFDITEALNSSLPVDAILKVVASDTLKILFVNTDDNGYSSLRYLFKDLYEYTADKEVSVFSDLLGRFISDWNDSSVADLLEQYFDTAKTYLKKVADGETLRSIIDENLVDKYVTDAFCKNLGTYLADILIDFNTDDTEDGSDWTDGDRYIRYAVRNYEIHITAQGETGILFNGHTYQSGMKADVTPSVENGMLAGLISVTFNDDIYTEKNVSWFTYIQKDVFHPEIVPESSIRYALSADMTDAVTLQANGENVERILPTIDLGIAYFNLNHVYRIYNKYTITLTDLQAGTKYYYQVGSDRYGWSDVFCFQTASDGAFSFMAITDIQGSIELNYTDSLTQLTQAVEYIGKDDISFILSGGDNVDNGKNIMQYTWMLNDQQSIWANNTFLSVAGNHEKKENALGSIFSLPDSAVVNDTGYYYSFDYNMAHFIVLDTNDLDTDGTLSFDQISWLEEDLYATSLNEKIKWQIVVLHKGPYTAGSHAFDADVIALRAQLTEYFALYEVDLVLEGHDHTYSVSQFLNGEGKATKNVEGGKYYNPDGVLYINLGTMGDKFYDYIYNEDVILTERNVKNYDSRLAPYFKDGKLELTESPVFTKITVTEDDLIIRSYTIINGEIVPVDDITITQKNNLLMTVLLSVGGGVLLIGLTIGGIILIRLHNKKKRAKEPKPL